MNPEIPKQPLRAVSEALPNKESLIVPQYSQKERKNPIFPSLSSPNRNFILSTQSNNSKIDNLYRKLAVCGTTSTEFVNIYNADILDLPIYCDNRCCGNPDCKKHRLYKFQKTHGGQELALQKSMRKPKGWIFTGYKMPIENLTTDFCRGQFLKLFHILKKQSLTEFSIHMEIKLNSDGTAYLHFHCVMGGLKDFRFTEKLWGRHIRYELAIRPKELAYYVSKYASKTPIFYSEFQMVHYHQLVYKTQMHRFSCNDRIHLRSEWIPMELLRSEALSCCYRTSYLNPNSKKHHYYELLENYDRPPDYRGRPWLNSSDVTTDVRINHTLDEGVIR